jgi:hypothetical protein
MHTGAFETGANRHLTSGLDHSGGSAQTLGLEIGIAHTVTVGLKVMETETRLIGARGLAADRLE